MFQHAALFSFVLASVASAQSVDIPYRKFTLENGLQVVVHEDHSDAVVSVYVSYHVGSAREELGKSGFAHLFEHMLFQGSQHVGDEKHFEYVTEAGGTLNGTTNTDRTVYYETLPSNHLELALWLEADRMGWLLPALTQATLSNQIDVVKNERRQNYENRPYAQGRAVIAQALYPADHPYSWLTIGSHEDLSGASLDDVKSFFRRWYGPNNATLAIGGDVDFDNVRAQVEKYFGSIPRGPGVDSPAPRPVTLDAVKRVVLEDRVQLPQLTFAWPSAPERTAENAALEALAAVLSANKSAVLDRALTVDEQLASNVSASQDGQELAGTFQISVRAQPGVTLDSLEERVQALLVKLDQDGVDPAALERALRRYESDFVRRMETVAARTGVLAESNALGGSPDAYQSEMAQRRAVTAADVQDVLRRFVLGRPAVVLSTVPMKKREMAATDKPFPTPRAAPEPLANRDQRPKPAATPAFHAPVVWHTQLENGLAVAGVRWNELPLSTISIAVPGGRTRESAQTLGLASLVANMLEQGSGSLDALAWARELDRLGAQLRVSVDDDEITITMSCLDAQFAEALGLVTDVVLKPRFDAADWARLVTERKTALETRNDQIRAIASDVFARLLYGDDTPLGRPAIGTRASIAALSLDDARAFWKTYALPRGSRIAYVGGLDAAGLKRALAPLASGWKGDAPAPVADPKTPAITETRLYLVDKPGAAQSEVRIGHMGPSSRDADSYALSIMNWPLGGSFSSRINLNLREAKGYTYGARSSFQGGTGPGPFVASGAVKTDVTAESVVEFMNELRGIRTGVRPEELAFAKESLGEGARRQYESTSALNGLLDNVQRYGWPDDYPTRRLAELDTMTVERLDALAQKWIHPDACVILVVGDKAKVGAKLAALGWGSPIELDPDGERVTGG